MLEFKLQYFHQIPVCVIETATTVYSSKAIGVEHEVIVNGMLMITSTELNTSRCHSVDLTLKTTMHSSFYHSLSQSLLVLLLLFLFSSNLSLTIRLHP